MNTYPFPVIDIECAAAFGVTIAELHSPSRRQPVSDARQAAMWFADLDDNYPHRIADFYGHSVCNVRYAIKTAENKLHTEKRYAARMNLIGERLMQQTCTPPETPLHRHD